MPERRLPAASLVLRPAAVVDESHLRDGMEIWVAGTEIAHVGQVGARSVDGVHVVDLPDVTVLPGLIDCHTHYLFDSESAGDSIAEAWMAPPQRTVLVGARNARRALEAGVTTARGAGAPHDLDVVLADAIGAGHIAGPRLIPSGRAVTITGGHGRLFGIAADDAGEMRVAVRTLVDAGAGVIKAVASEAAMRVDDRAGIPEMDEAELEAIVQEAARLGRRVLAHAQDAESVRAAARAGVASVEHAFLADRDALVELARSGSALTPTLVVTDVYRSRPLSATRRARQEEIERAHRASCETAIALGIPIVAGTDCGLPGVHSDMLWREIALLVDHGLAPIEAIGAATWRAAAVLGIADEVGTLRAGRRADLVAVAGDPLADLTRLREPILVLQAGRVVVDRRFRATGPASRSV